MRSLTWKITLSLILTSLLGVGFVAVFAGIFTSRQFEQFRVAQMQQEFKAAAEAYYRATGSLNGFYQTLPTYVENQVQSQEQERDQEQRRGREPHDSTPVILPGVAPLMFFLVDTEGRTVSPAPGVSIGDRIPSRELQKGEVFVVDDEVIGTLITLQQPRVPTELERRFFAQVNRGLGLSALGVVLAASLVGLTLARRLTTPLRELTEALRGMHAGKLEQRVEINSQDEIGELVTTFNQMSAEVARANHLRRQMTADIAHDLRTPLGVISGYLEALRDGTLSGTQERFDTLYNEAQLLQRLVDDLRTLSLADAGELSLNREAIDGSEYLQDVQHFYESRAAAEGLTLRTEIASSLPPIDADRARLGQILANLISNAIRHTPAGGSITLGAVGSGTQVRLFVQDTGEGIEPEKLPHVFDRFYRVDESRTHEDGQSGLGLAITKALVEAHGGSIHAESQPGQGTTMWITLPQHGA